MDLPNYIIRCIDLSKFPGASLITVRGAQAETNLSEAQVKKASTPTRIGRENYVLMEEVNEAIRRYEHAAPQQETPLINPMHASGSSETEAK
jgi:hypothetical protein